MVSTIPGPAGDLVRAVIEAVDAALRGDDAARYDEAAAWLVTRPAGGRVLGDVLRSLLEDTHPDGLDSDDVTLVVGRCYRAAAAWLPPERLDVTVLLAVLAGALGVFEPGTGEPGIGEPGIGELTDDALDRSDPDITAPTWPDFAWHGPLLVADLLPFAPGTLEGYLESAFAEYARQAREELP